MNIRLLHRITFQLIIKHDIFNKVLYRRSRCIICFVLVVGFRQPKLDQYDDETLFRRMSYLKIITIMRNDVILTLQTQLHVTEDHHPSCFDQWSIKFPYVFHAYCFQI